METSALILPDALLLCLPVDNAPHDSQPDTPGACCRKALPDSPSVCMVHGCDKELEKAYDKKCRTCTSHRQAAVVEFNGAPHRFCQKCSRFHALSEFDGTKRNCRQRLYEHNYRQRRLRMLRKAAQQNPSAPFSYPTQTPTSVYSGSPVYQAQPSSPPTVAPGPVNLSTDLEIDFNELDPLLDDVNIGDLFIPGFFDSDSIKSHSSDTDGIAKVQSASASRSSNVNLAPANASVSVPTMAPQRAYFPASTSGNTFLSGDASMQSSMPIELDEFLWLEQSLAQSASTLNHAFPILPPIASYPILY